MFRMSAKLATRFAQSTGTIRSSRRFISKSQVFCKLAQTRDELKDSTRVVVKLGSAVVTKPDRSGLALGRLAAIVEQMADLSAEGRQCVLVTSGAVALGRHHLDSKAHSSRGARAALGMAEMVSLYGHLFEQCDLRTAAMLLTPVDFDDDHRRAYWRLALQDLMNQGVVPIINTNDAVAWDGETMSHSNQSQEFEAPPVKDNDSLAARLACELSSDLLILVSDVDGVYTGPPGSPGATLIPHYKVINENGSNGHVSGQFLSFGETSSVGTGGMQSKVSAAEWTVRQGTAVVVCHGNRPNCLRDILHGADVGTFFTLSSADDLPESGKQAADPIRDIARNVRRASFQLNLSSADTRARAIEHLADLLVVKQADILVSNTKDIRAAEKAGLGAALTSRLQLGPNKIQTLSNGLKQIAQQCRDKNGYVGGVVERTKLADQLILEKVITPIGVLMVIFESRPDCLPQVAALSIASANGLLAKPGSEALHTVRLLHTLTQEALQSANLPPHAVEVIEGRSDVQRILGMGGTEPLVDLVIPRGSSSMIQSVRAAVAKSGSGIPVIGHGAGICHVYVDKDADAEKALRIVKDAKCDYPAACNAMETLLVHESHVNSGLLEKLCKCLKENGVELFVGPKLNSTAWPLKKSMKPAKSLSHEYGDLQCTVELVDDLQDALHHIELYGSAHTEAIVTENVSAAEEFLQKSDSACVFHNASTRFADGYRFGLGAEVGINTGRIHARGPVGIEGLLTTKWILRGNGQCASDFSSGKQTFEHIRLPVN